MDGYVTIGTKLDTKDFDKSLSSLQTGLERKMDGMTSTVTKAFTSLKKTIIGLGLFALIRKMFNFDDAVKRVDALNNFPRVMGNLGISAKDAEASIKRMSNALLGLPTTLDEATLSVQRFTSANGNVKASTEMFLALNNAILAGGASTQVQSTALEQLSQAYAKGKPDMMEWRSAMTAMPAQLKQVAMAMGYVSSAELGEALRSGAVSMNDFMLKIVELNKKGVNGFKSFDEQARNSTGGIATSLKNLKTTFTRAFADILDTVGQSNIAAFFDKIKNAIIKVTPYIAAFIKMLLMLFGIKNKKQADETASSFDNLGASVSETTDDFNDATGAAKKLNKELKGLASFDEMNVLPDKTESDSGGASAAASGLADFSNLDFSMFDDLEEKTADVDKIVKKVEKVFGRIGEILKNVWDSGPVQAYVEMLKTKFGFIKYSAEKLGREIYMNITGTWNNIKDNVSETVGNMGTLIGEMSVDITNGINEWGGPIIEAVSQTFHTIWQDAIDPAIQLISQAWADFSGILVELWKKHGAPLVNNIGEFVKTVIGLFKKIWDDVLEPIVTPFLETLSWLWDKHLKSLVKEVGDFIGKLVNGALEIYNKVVAPILSYLLDKLAPAWAFVSNFVIGVLGTAFAYISDTFKNILKIFGGIIDFITGVFTGNWRKAWEGVKSVFSGIMGGLFALIKLPLNLIIDGINSFIAGVNKIKIPDWVPGVGGKGFNIRKIPKLARGTIVNAPGRGVPTPSGNALYGEAGPEAYLPLSDTQLLEQLGSTIGKYININATIPVQIGNRLVAREIKRIYAEDDFAFNR